ncbi:hypothetical protein NW762_013047 [Fusarium torreyae]|uniref:Uncharacterized protein n=1 Tax=Fusarium torreyae TaxID=1237075 RepID=A0A9W8V883_9HYPO|nr:hypothetical protein NW762_013047 [Fusarium torreyae]
MDEVKGDANKAWARCQACYHDFKTIWVASLVAAGPRKLLKLLIIFIITSFSFLLLVTFPKNLESTASEWLPYKNNPAPGSPPSEPIDKDRRFAFVIPSTSPNPELCKTIVSAMALGYPSPVIINWGLNHSDITKWHSGRNLPKIPGFVKYLDAVMHPDAHPSERLEEDDIVLLVDAYDVWFQLPPQVLLSRYHKINEEANERLRKQWKRKEPMPMKQTVIAASGKRCTPDGPDAGVNLRCDNWPMSPLRKDLYGPKTEKKARKYRTHRPRYINGGVYMGPAGDIRRLFRRAMEKMDTGIGHGFHWKSEQAIPGEVMGEQETWRKWRRKHAVSDPDLGNLIGRDFEYHFGVDYAQGISVQTWWTRNPGGHFDGDFVTLNNQSDINRHSKALGISPVRLKGLPKDMRSLSNPLAAIEEEADWGDMPLYADFFTESVPVILHHNGWKARRQTIWHKPWYHKRLRELLSAQLTTNEAVKLMADVHTEDGRIKYWGASAEATDRNPRRMNDTATERLPSMEFKELCRYPGSVSLSAPLSNSRIGRHHWYEEVFRDREGPIPE